MMKTTFCLLGLVLALSACPSSEDGPRAPDDSSDPGPAEGDTGGPACEAEQATIKKLEAENEQLEAELAECRDPK